MSLRQAVQHVRHGEGKGFDRRIEVDALFGAHLIAALHGANRCRQRGTAGIAEILSRLEIRLLADDALPEYLLHLAIGVGDQPVPADQPGSALAGVADGNGVGEHILICGGIRLALDIGSAYVDLDMVLLCLTHR